MKLYEHWGDYTGELDSECRACGVGQWMRDDLELWVGLFKDDGGHGKLTFYQ